MIELITGFLASITSTISFFPQIIKIYKTKSTNDISSFMVLNFLATSILWSIYGYITQSFPVVLCNGFGILSSCWLCYLKLKYD